MNLIKINNQSTNQKLKVLINKRLIHQIIQLKKNFKKKNLDVFLNKMKLFNLKIYLKLTIYKIMINPLTV